MTSLSFAALGLAEPLLRSLSAEGYDTPTPIQTQAIPLLLAGRDLLGIAQTGTGKTAAFALPILQRLAELRTPRRPKECRALVLAPTRELSIQIADSFAAYGRHLGLRRTVIVGGVAQGPQRAAMAEGVDILVATPGRLLDLMTQGHVRLSGVTHLVLDEADRMLDMGFIRDIRKILAALPARRQTMLLSATMPAPVETLAGEILARPVRIEVTPKIVTVERIEQHVIHVGPKGRRPALLGLLSDPALARVIVFTRTKRGANRVAEDLLEAGIEAEAIHGNKSQNARQKALDRFRDGRARVLVATDIAARGIDVDGVTHVINYELPLEPESYVHRIGRTARAGAGGRAVSLCEAGERDQLRRIERLTGRPLGVIGDPPRAGEASGDARKAAPSPARARRGRRRWRPAAAA